MGVIILPIPWRKKWHPTPVLLPGKFHGWRTLVGYSPWSHKELDMTEQLHFISFCSFFWRRKWQPTPVFLPGESHGQRGLVGCKESDMTKQPTHRHTPLGLASLISLLSKGLSRVYSSTTVQSFNSSVLNILYGPTLTSIHDHWKNHSLD